MEKNGKIKETKVENSKVGRYLTDMKELPPSANSEDPPEAVKKEFPKKNPLPKTEPSAVAKEYLKKGGDSIPQEEKDGAEVKKVRTFSLKDIILGVINLILVVSIIVLLIKLPQKAKEYQTEKIEEIHNEVNPDNEYGNMVQDAEKSEKLNSLFLDDSGVVNFVSDVERLKKENPTINRVIFASPKATKDENGLLGVLVTIELKGNWQLFAPALEKIQTLPYLFRPISIDAGPSKDDPNVIIFNYGGFLYISEKGQNK